MGAFVSALTAYIDALPWLTAAVVLYAVTAGCTVSAIVTTTPLNFMAGPKLGIIAGSLVFNAGATTGSVLNFLIGRFLLRDWAERKLRRVQLFRIWRRQWPTLPCESSRLRGSHPCFPCDCWVCPWANADFAARFHSGNVHRPHARVSSL